MGLREVGEVLRGVDRRERVAEVVVALADAHDVARRRLAGLGDHHLAVDNLVALADLRAPEVLVDFHVAGPDLE